MGGGERLCLEVEVSKVSLERLDMVKGGGEITYRVKNRGRIGLRTLYSRLKESLIVRDLGSLIPS